MVSQINYNLPLLKSVLSISSGVMSSLIRQDIINKTISHEEIDLVVERFVNFCINMPDKSEKEWVDAWELYVEHDKKALLSLLKA